MPPPAEPLSIIAGQSGADILIVDDNPADLRVLSGLLSEQGYRLRVAVGGAQGLKAARLVPPDLILLDVVMPDMDGYEVCRQLKADSATRSVPVVFLSSLDSTEEKVNAFEVGAEDYVAKPFQAAEVLARVRTHLGRQQAEAALREANRRLQAQVAEIEALQAELRRQTEEQIRKLSLAVEQSPSLVVIADAAGAIEYVNPTFTRVTGYTLEEVAGKTFFTLPEATVATALQQQVKDAVASGSEWRGEFQNRKKNGQPFWARVVVSPIRSPEGVITHFVQVEEDITERRQAEEEANRLFEEVRAGREHLRSLSLRLMESHESERREVARELHDEIGQILTGLKLTLSVSRQLPPGPIASGLAEARALAEELLGRVRDLSLDLRPAMLDDLGLLPALLYCFERYTARTGLQVAFRHAGVADRRFDPRLETAAFRIVQEALTNVARHARVQAVEVRLLVDPETLEVHVEDRGAGFSPEAALAAGRSGGLAGIRERVNLLGGSLSIEAVPGGGTCLACDLPLAIAETDRGGS